MLFIFIAFLILSIFIHPYKNGLRNFLPRPTLMENNLQGLSVRIITLIMFIHIIYSKIVVFTLFQIWESSFKNVLHIFSGIENLQHEFVLSTKLRIYLHIHSFTELHPWKRKMERSRKSEINEFLEISYLVGISFCLLTQKQKYGHVYVYWVFSDKNSVFQVIIHLYLLCSTNSVFTLSHFILFLKERKYN